MYQYAPYLTAAGHQVATEPFFDGEYLNNLYAGRPTRQAAIQAYHRRVRTLRAGNADLLWVEKELLPFVPWVGERAFLPKSIPMVSDYDDAVFHRYDMHGQSLVRRFLGRKIGRIMAASRVVMAGNSYLANHARSAGAERVEIVPTVVDVDHYRPSQTDGGALSVGWIGSPSTWREFGVGMLDLVLETLKPLEGQFRVVGAGRSLQPRANIEVLNWTEDREVEMVQGMDIGIMPLSETPWARGKCGYKLIQYMACGLPVVASPVGVNREIVEHGVNGFLASTPAEWREALTTLLRDPTLRRRMGMEGRKKVERAYSLQVWGPRVAELLTEAAG